ncbi:MAG: AAA family ATPase [Lysobacter sp.]
MFFGRQKEVGALIEQLNTPGQHSLLFGDRGVGKSSLANIASELLLKRFIAGELFQKRCDSADTFVSVVAAPLRAVGIDVSESGSSRSKAEGGAANIGIPGLGAKVDSHTTTIRELAGARELASPSWVAEKLSGLKGLLLIDEVDALTNSRDRHLLAELVKQLSDRGADLKVLLVGIADTGAHLTAGHPSVNRCLKETRLKRMSNDELREIIEGGEKRAGLAFSDTAKNRIIKVSSGYAHFTHLLALKAAEDAIAAGKGEIFVSDVVHSTRRAVDDAEGSLKRAYDDATRSHQTDEYRRIICAAAECGADEFSAGELRAAYKGLWGVEIKQSALNNYFIRLVAEGDGNILRRLAKGVYRFNDPRMPSFIKIANPLTPSKFSD